MLWMGGGCLRVSGWCLPVYVVTFLLFCRLCAVAVLGGGSMRDGGENGSVLFKCMYVVVRMMLSYVRIVLNKLR